MRLFYSVGSPFARIIRIALLETGLDAVVRKHEMTRSQLYSPQSAVLSINPVGRVPALELDDGTVLTESKLIIDYIDTFNPGEKLLPRDGSDGWQVMAELGQALGILDSIMLWIRARSLPEKQWPVESIRRETARIERAACSLDERIARAAYQRPINAAQIVLGTALGLAENRLCVWDWRQGRSNLSKWYDTIALRPSFKNTEPPSG